MTAGLATLELTLLAALLFGVLGASVCAIVYPLIHRRLTCLTPTVRAHALLAWAMAPFFISVLLTLLYFLPSVLSFLGWAPAHCPPQDHPHPHFCSIHPHVSLSADGATRWVLVISGGWLLLAIATQLWGWLRARRLLAALTAMSHYDTERRVRVVETSLPLALTAGLWRSQIYVSSCLTASLPADMLTVIVTHERTHARRRDGLRQFVANLFSLIHLPWTRRQLLSDLDLACEQACDEAAAHEISDRLRVAETLLTIERLFQGSFRPLGLGTNSFGSSHVVERVERLLADPKDERNFTGFLWVVLIPVALVLAAEPLHRFTEAVVLGLLAR